MVNFSNTNKAHNWKKRKIAKETQDKGVIHFVDT